MLLYVLVSFLIRIVKGSPRPRIFSDNASDRTWNLVITERSGQPVFSQETQIFNVCRTMLQMFYHSLEASVIFYAEECRVKVADDSNRLNKLIRRAGSVRGVEVVSLVELSERRILRKQLSILDNSSHPLHATLESYQCTFSNRLRPQRSTTQCHRRSFLPVDIKLCNS